MNLYSSFDEFRDALVDATGLKVYQYRTPKGKIGTPYIIIAEGTDNSFRADNSRYIESKYVDVFLFSYQAQDSNNTQKDIAEKALQNYFESNEIPFDKQTDWLESLQLFQTSFTVTIWYGSKE